MSTYILIGLILVGIAIFMNLMVIAFMISPYRKFNKARSWEQTQGQIESSTIAASHVSGTEFEQYPLVVYNYTAGGQARQNDDIILDGNPEGIIYSTRMVNRYPAGSQVTVYYNPQNPEESVLERNLPGFVRILWVVLIFGNGLLFLIGCVTAYSGL